MAFICTHDTLVNRKLRRIGLSLDDVTSFSPDARQDPVSLIIGVDAKNSKPKKTPIDKANADPNCSFEASMGMALRQFAIIPRGFVDSTGVNGICFHCVYCLTTLGEEKPKRKGKKRGEYRLDPTNSYTLAKQHDEFFLNRITIKESDLSRNTWQLLFDFLEERHNMKASIAYILANIPAATFHRIRTAKPKKETLLKLGIIIQLTLEEMVQWLESAGLAFNPSDKRDALIKKCFQEGVLNPLDINKLLYSEHLKCMKFGNFNRLNPH